jgi:hypothetical protein
MLANLGFLLLLEGQCKLHAQANEPPPAATKAAVPQPSPQPVELSVWPAAQPSPALRYRLLPLSSELNPGDAAPIYLRLRHELLDARWNEIAEKNEAWGSMPLDKLPMKEVRKFVDTWRGTTALLKIGSRRKFCDWSYPLAEQRQDIIEMLLPDCQSMRQWSRLLQLQARVETAEHSYDLAIDTIETGIAFGRHVGEGPFLINNLVGVAICAVMLERVEELITRPGAPNLYWALTALPRPLISMREALETEQRVGENLVPELTQMDEFHSRAEWGVLLERFYDRLGHLAERIASDAQVNAKLRAKLEADLASYKKENLGSSQEYLKSIRHIDALKVNAMSEDEVLARALVGQYRDMRDDLFKLSYLPWRDLRFLHEAAEQRLNSAKAGPLAVLAELQSSILNSLGTQMYLDRRVAALRVVEAIRLYAASHDGMLPEELSQIVEVPVPGDPATGNPFEYCRDGTTSVLTLPEAKLRGRPIPSYRITIRPQSEKKP